MGSNGKATLTDTLPSELKMLCWQRDLQHEMPGVKHNDTFWYREHLQRCRLIAQTSQG